MVKSNVSVGSLNSFSNQVARLEHHLMEYRALSRKADAIGQNAVTAAGGSGTAVGAALTANFENVNSEEMQGTINSLIRFIDGTKHISKQMFAAYEDFLSKIASVNKSEE